MIRPRFSRHFIRKMIIFSSESIDQIVKVSLPAKLTGLTKERINWLLI